MQSEIVAFPGDGRVALLLERGLDDEPLITLLLSTDGDTFDASVELDPAVAEEIFKAGLRMVAAIRSRPSLVR